MLNCFEKDKPNWSGTWRGMMYVYPREAGPENLEVTLQLGPFPTEENNCTTWLGTYRQHGQVVVVKDYRLCRRNSDEDLFIDEQNGIILDSQWIGGELITPYKAENMYFVVINRLRGDIFEEEIITVDEKNTGEKIQSLRTHAIYKSEMKRIN